MVESLLSCGNGEEAPLRFPVSTGKALAENVFRGPCETNPRFACLRPVPLLPGVPIPLPRSVQPVDLRFAFSVSLVRTPAVAGVRDMQLKQTDAMKIIRFFHQLIRKE